MIAFTEERVAEAIATRTCPVCAAEPGDQCRTPVNGQGQRPHPIDGLHLRRWNAYARTPGEVEPPPDAA